MEQNENGEEPKKNIYQRVKERIRIIKWPAIGIIGAVYEKFYHAKANHKERYRKDSNSYISANAAVVMAATSLVTLIIGIFGYFILKSQIDEMKAASEIARQTLITANRAWIAPFDAELAEPIEIGKPITTLLKYQNLGKEPAIDIEFSSRSGGALPPNDGAGVNTMTFPPNNSCENDPEKIMIGNVVYQAAPGNEFYEIIQSSKSPWLGSNEILSGAHVYLIMGCLKYRTFGKIQRSGYCFYLSPARAKLGRGAKLQICTSGNFAD